MKTLIILLVVALTGIALGQQRRCPANMIQLFNGVSCSTDAMCYNMAPGYFCLNGYCCSNSASSPSGYGSSCTYQSQCSFANSQCLNNICYCAAGYDYDGYSCQSSGQTGNCAINQVLINGRCYATSLPGGSCQYDQQCNDPLSKKQLYCGSGICRWVFSGNPTCRNPSSAIERINGVIKNCLYQDCSFGYQCEYNSFFNNGQYICCSSNGGGGNNGGNNGQPGQIKFYPGTSLPLECRAINACTFVDFPHCVYSQRYGYQVCCSTQYCY